MDEYFTIYYFLRTTINIFAADKKVIFSVLKNYK